MLGDCLEQLKKLTDDSVDSIVTDPPYELGFMGKKWDASGIAYNVELWQECLRVLKPGGHLLAFSGSRTYHRMTVAIEDAGFEIRDQIMWVYGSGFPKSLNVSKAIDKGAEREVVRIVDPRSAYDGIDRTSDATNTNWRNAEGRSDTRDLSKKIITTPSTEDAKQWDGWGTALKPAHEPICVARKPLIGTVAQNVLEHGTGGLNIDGCRIEHITVGDGNLALNPHLRTHINGGNGGHVISSELERRVVTPNLSGRFPANFIHDGSDEVIGLFPETGKSTGGIAKAGKFNNKYGEFSGNNAVASAGGFEDAGSAARFFYCAKASKKDRNEGLDDFPDVLGGSLEGGNDTRDGKDQPQLRLTKNNHPTVKPTSLMRYLCKLITPPTGTVLDPFMGSGSTGKAAVLEGFNFIGIERDESYFEIATARIEHATKHGEKSDKKSNQSSTGSSNNTHFDDIFE
jgi:site-specific DNA-methyltransferase (adenine-specific)